MKNASNLFKVSSTALIVLLSSFCTGEQAAKKIDRHSVVKRNDIVHTKPNLQAPLTVGNGKFAFTVDPTGLQTFPEIYDSGFVLGTMADFGWHYRPNPNNYKIEDVYKEFDSHGRKVLYAYDHPVNIEGSKLPYRRPVRIWLKDASKWLYENPSRMDLGQIGLAMKKADGTRPGVNDLKNIRQHLELWTGVLTSYFELDGQPVTVQTMVHPTLDMVAVKIQSPLLDNNRISVEIKFPYANGTWTGSSADWDNPEKHATDIISETQTRLDLSRHLDDETSTLDDYKCTVAYPKGTTVKRESKHHFQFFPAGGGQMELCMAFAETAIPDKLPSFSKTKDSTVEYWKNYWSKGGFIDLSESKDPRWKALEKRIILSQYVTAVNCASKLPPQECGLVQKSWHGKFHMEMLWWHTAHFALWGRTPLMLNSMDYYNDIMESAKHRAQVQGYKGARWPKMTDPKGGESPNSINPFLVWQQPHPLYFAELHYRQNPSQETLNSWWNIVRETADFMASFAAFNKDTGFYDLGPPLNDVHEDSEISGTKNTPYEVVYFRFGLAIARKWRERMGLAPDPLWDKVQAHLAPLESKNGRYTAPAIVFGTLPLPQDIDFRVLDNTVQHWAANLPEQACSWSYPVQAMAAARAGRPDLAIDILLFPSECNSVSDAGYNYWNDVVPVYLPGNGALLSAVAMMAAGWDNAPEGNAPGFPKNGQWTVKYEGLYKIP